MSVQGIDLFERKRNSMNFWYPKIKDLDIAMPKTKIIMLPKKYQKTSHDESEITNMLNNFLVKKVEKAIKEFGYPAFVRTDQASAKHFWNRACFIDNKDKIKKNLFEIIEFNICAGMMGLDYKSFVVREYIPLESSFTAFFGKMPVSRERRYYVKDGKVLCHHPYWIEEAINEPSVKSWKKELKILNTESKIEVSLLSDYAKEVSKAIEGFWSVDFAKAKNGRWLLIDMALGTHSWHPIDCEVYKKMPHIDHEFKKRMERNRK